MTTTKISRAERNIRWIEKWCRIPEGRHVGKPVVLREWQRAEIRKIYDNPAGTRQAIISFPRKNGKTALIAFLLLLHICGPEAKPNSQLYSAAQSRDQAATVFKLAAKVVRQNKLLNDNLIIRDTAKEIACPGIGTIYAALSADKSTAHGKSPIFAVHDELGQVKGPVSELYDAIETGMGAHDNPLSIVISTQAPTDNDLLSRIIDAALAGSDPQTTCTLYTAPKEADPFSLDTLRDCNPAWGDFLNDKEVLRTMEKAREMPSQEASYRNLHLNQRILLESPFVSRAVWDSCKAAPGPLEGLDVYAGLDLSAVNDLTAFVAMGMREGVWHTHSTFWLPQDGIREKSHHDRVPYDVWLRNGFLLAAPGKSVDYRFVASYLREFANRHKKLKIAFDRWGFRFLRPWLIEAGFTEKEIDSIFVEFGQGFQSMSPALRELEGDLLNGRVAHGGHPILSMCAANAVVRPDPAGNRKLDKSKSTSRIDGLVSMAMARGIAPLDIDKAVRPQMFFLGAR